MPPEARVADLHFCPLFDDPKPVGLLTKGAIYRWCIRLSYDGRHPQVAGNQAAIR
jgi:hypothetical protein